MGDAPLSLSEGPVALTYYHVLITTKSEPALIAGETALDLSQEDLFERFLTPRSEGRPVTINGRVMHWDEIDRILVSKSEDDWRHVAESLRREKQRRERESGVAVIDTTPTGVRVVRGSTDITDEVVKGTPGTARPDTQTRGEPTSIAKTQASRTVFVVHGRNVEARNAMFAFLRSVDLQPLEWAQAVKATGKPMPYIGEILDAAFWRLVLLSSF